MELPEIVTAAEWRAAHNALLAREKAATRALDALAAERRRLPMAELDADHAFETPAGPARLLDLFDGRTQLIVYHFMLEPDSDHVCEGCAMFADTIGHLAHLHARDTALVLASRAPVAQIEQVRARMGWQIPWASCTPAFAADCGIGGGFGLSVFVRDGARVFRTYFTSGRGVERLGSHWTLLDLTPLGRQERWEDSPAGRPQGPPYTWWRLHDEYPGTAAPSQAAPAAPS